LDTAAYLQSVVEVPYTTIAADTAHPMYGHLTLHYMQSKDITGALLMWMMYIKKRYDGIVGNYIDITGFVKEFV
jgi:hypothetical protein